MKLKFVFGAAVVVAAAAATIAFASDDLFQGNVVKKPFDSNLHGPAAKTTSNQILYHGGPVMHPVSVYVIYYGNFSANPLAQPIINDFLTDLSTNAAPFSVNGTYTDSTGTAVPPSYYFKSPSASTYGQWSGTVYFDNYSQGTQLGTSSPQRIVASALASGVNKDPNGVYLVVTSPDVKISGFCTSFCAYHNTSTAIVSGMTIRYALVPDPTQKCSGCNGTVAKYSTDTQTPNGDMGADTVTDDIMHELSETVSDPDINAWYTQSGAENGDLCNYVYETTAEPIQTYSQGGVTYHYNFQGLHRKYLIQYIWKNLGAGYCSAK